MGKNRVLIINIVVAIVIGSIAFYSGMKYSESKNIASSSGLGGQFAGRMGPRNGDIDATGTARQGGMRNGFRPVLGEVLDIDESTMTVKLTDGSTKIVILSDKTVASKSEEVAITEVVQGEKVSVLGTTNADGTVTAQTIQINPIMRNFAPPIPPTQ